MLRGRFGGSSDQPYISSRVLLPRLNLTGNVSFVFDTGADGSVLMPADAKTLGVDYADLSEPIMLQGIGGQVPASPEHALLIFFDHDDERVYGYDISLSIHHPTPGSEHVPSLSGRDVIDRWRVIYDRSDAGLTATVLSADKQHP